MKKTCNCSDLADKVKGLEREVSRLAHVEAGLQQQTLELSRRVKELDCLYAVSNLLDDPLIALEEIVRKTASFIHKALPDPENTSIQITLDTVEYCTDDFPQATTQQSIDVNVPKHPKGKITLGYNSRIELCPENILCEQGQKLLNAVAERLGKIIERDNKLKKTQATLRQREEELLHQQKRTAVLKFANEIAMDLIHELRNPMVSIGGLARLITNKEYSQDKLRKYTRVIAEQTQRLEKSLNRALENMNESANESPHKSN